jgi:hypothetical protein
VGAQAASEAEVERLSTQLQETIVSAEVGRAKVLLYDELSNKAEHLVRPHMLSLLLPSWLTSRTSAASPGSCQAEAPVVVQQCSVSWRVRNLFAHHRDVLIPGPQCVIDA